MQTSGTDPCPCDSGYPLAVCCGPFLAGLGPAPTAEALMRSRYVAWTLGRTDYLLATWHPDTRPPRLEADPGVRWLGLKVLATRGGAPGDETGSVEFVARSKVGGRARRMHEVSRFRFESGRWLYVDGRVSTR